jgi:V/A-type H+-transporting ATPase subunit E
MVTIEQKLLLFSKLLHQSMDKKYAEELEEIEKQYEYKLQKNKEEVDKEVEAIEENARKKVEAYKSESISKAKINIKKESMAVKEKHFKILMEHLRNNLKEFVESEIYKQYLLNLLVKLSEEMSSIDSDNLIIYLTQKDNEKFGSLLKKELELKYKYNNVVLKTINDNVIGGIIAEFPEKNIRIDLTIRAVLEENEFYIMQTLYEMLEVGEHNGL